MEPLEAVSSPLFPQQALSNDTALKLPAKPLAHSGSVQLYLILAEKILYIQGFEEAEYKERPPALLRGSMFLRISKPVKIKSISLKFSGVAKTDWPEGIPPKKVDFQEVNQIMSHTWPFFNATMAPADVTKGANIYRPADSPGEEISSFSLEPAVTARESAASGGASAFASVLRRAASPSPIRATRSRSSTLNVGNTASSLLGHLAGGGSSSHLDAVSSNDLQSLRSIETGGGGSDLNSVRTFTPGDYIYNFELPIPASTPETMSATFGSVKYALEASVERAGAFKTSLLGRETVTIIRTPSDSSLEENEPIAIVRDWEDKLTYEIVIASKAVVLNTYLPMAFKLTPLDKIQLHRVRVYLTENMEYYCRHMKIHRLEPTRKYLLLEHKPPEGSTSLLGDEEITAKELEFQVYVPERLNEKARLHPDTSYQQIQSHHWVKICLRLSKSDPTEDNPLKRKHYEISIDSPIHVLSPLATHANTLLPSYNQPVPPALTYMDTPPLSPNVIAIDNSLDALIASPDADPHADPHADQDQLHDHDPGVYHVPNMNLDSNIYKPAKLAPELQSPQAQPFSPIVSPEMAALSPNLQAISSPSGAGGAASPAMISRPIHLLRRPSVGPPPFDAEAPPPGIDADDPPAYEETDRKRAPAGETDIGEEFEFTGLSPHLPNAIARATSPAPPAAAHRSSSALRNVTSSSDIHLSPVLAAAAASPLATSPPLASSPRRVLPHTAESLLNQLSDDDEADEDRDHAGHPTDPHFVYTPGPLQTVAPTTSLSPTNAAGSYMHDNVGNALSPTSSATSGMSVSTQETNFDAIGEPLLYTTSTSTVTTDRRGSAAAPPPRGRLQSLHSTDISSMYYNANSTTNSLQQARSESIWHPLESDFSSINNPHIFKRPQQPVAPAAEDGSVPEGFRAPAPPSRPQRQMSFGVEQIAADLPVSESQSTIMAPAPAPAPAPATVPQTPPEPPVPRNRRQTTSSHSVTTSLESTNSSVTLKTDDADKTPPPSAGTVRSNQMHKWSSTSSSRQTSLEDDPAETDNYIKT